MVTFEEFIASYPRYTFEKGQLLLLKDEIPRGVYVIESGLIKTYTINANGEERLISIDSQGEDIPIGFTIGLIDRSEYFYEAYVDCVVRLVPADAYRRHMTQNLDSLIKRHIRLTKILLSTLKRIEALEQTKASDKVAHTLIYLGDKMGERLPPGRGKLRLMVTQQEIANFLGLTRETAGVALKKMELQKLVAYSRNNYVLYVEKLKKYLNRSP